MSACPQPIQHLLVSFLFRITQSTTIYTSNEMPQNGSRQQSGFACEECRRRKTRCDRARPTCGPCVETGRVCVTRFKNSQRGGPKTTGQLNAMRLQIGISHPLVQPLVNRTPHSDFDCNFISPYLTCPFPDPNPYFHDHLTDGLVLQQTSSGRSTNSVTTMMWNGNRRPPELSKLRLQMPPSTAWMTVHV